MTGHDTGRLLQTLYERADNIAVQHSIHRVIFHAAQALKGVLTYRDPLFIFLIV